MGPTWPAAISAVGAIGLAIFVTAMLGQVRGSSESEGQSDPESAELEPPAA